jgi:hypothetical protein
MFYMLAPNHKHVARLYHKNVGCSPRVEKDAHACFSRFSIDFQKVGKFNNYDLKFSKYDLKFSKYDLISSSTSPLSLELSARQNVPVQY